MRRRLLFPLVACWALGTGLAALAQASAPAAGASATGLDGGSGAALTAAAPDANADDQAFELRMKTLQEQVADLKEKVFRTKARLMMLQETVLGGDLSSGARAVLVHRNEMGGSFILESVAYALDGAPIFTKVDVNGDLSGQKELAIFDGRIMPGQHQLAVRMVYRGHGYGIFSYLEGYKFKLQSSDTFNAEAAKVTTVKIVGFERGGLTTELKDRPAIRFDQTVSQDTGLKPVQAAPDTN